MGYNFAVAALADTTLADLERLGVTTTGETTSGDLALEEFAPYACERDGQLVLACLEPDLLDLAQHLAARRGVRGAAAVFGSTGGAHLLWMRDGDRERLRVMQDGEVVDTVGPAWPEEEVAFASTDFEEDAVADSFAAVTGVTVLDDAWLEGEFHELDPDEVSDLLASAGSPAAVPAAAASATPATEEPVAYPVGDATVLDLASVQVTSKVVGVLLGLGAVIEVLFGVFALMGESFGLLIPHVAFAALAVLTLRNRRDDSQALMWTSLSVVILMISVGVTLAEGSDHPGILSAFLVFLAVLIVAMGLHVWRMRRLVRSVTG